MKACSYISKVYNYSIC